MLDLIRYGYTTHKHTTNKLCVMFPKSLDLNVSEITWHVRYGQTVWRVFINPTVQQADP